MRLVCPNCAAQYEVDESAIPENGRSVQCASCGDTWFQKSAQALAAENTASPVDSVVDSAVDSAVDEDAKAALTENSEIVVDETEVSAEDAPAEIAEILEDAAEMPEAPISPAEQEKSDTEEDTDEDEDGDEDEDEGSPPSAEIELKAPPAADQSILDILRNEAEHEAKARQSDGAPQGQDETPSQPGTDPVETPGPALNYTPDLDIPAEDEGDDSGGNEDLLSRARAVRVKVNSKRRGNQRLHISGADANAGLEDLVAAPKRQDTEPRAEQLPDVDELNSTLRSAKDKGRAEVSENPEPQQRGGGRFGFYLAVLIALMLVAGYSLNAQIAEAVPGAKPYLTTYVALVDQARLGLQDMATVVVAAVKNLMAQYF